MSFAPLNEDEKKQITSQGFAPLSEEEVSLVEKGPLEFSLKGAAKGALEALPMAGGIAGGTIGTALGGPFGTIAGGTLGASLGKSLENFGEQFLLDEEKTRGQIYTEPLIEAGASAAGEIAVPMAGGAIKQIGKSIGSGVKKLSSELSGIPEKAYETYLKRPKEVSRLGDLSEGTSLQDAVDNLRSNATATIWDVRNTANDEIYWALKDKANRKVNVKSIIDAGESVIKDLNPKIKDHAAQIADIRGMIDQITNLQISPKLPIMNVMDVHNMKTVLQDAADYGADGAFKQKSNLADKAMKEMARKARLLVEEVAPEISKQNGKLVKLHRLNKNINKNLLSPEKTTASVLAVGSGANQQAIKQMRKLEDLTKYPYIKVAEDITAAQYFNNPKLLPVQTTGRSTIAAGSAGGGIATSAMSGDLWPAIAGTTIGSIGSPKIIKGGLDLIREANKASDFVMKKSPGAVEMGEQLIKRAIQMGIPPYLIDNEIKNYDGLSPTEKAKLRNKNAKEVK